MTTTKPLTTDELDRLWDNSPRRRKCRAKSEGNRCGLEYGHDGDHECEWCGYKWKNK